MTMTRITITLPEDDLAELKAAVPKGELSSYVLDAIRQRLRQDPVEAMLHELDRIRGPLTDFEKTQGDHRWNASTQALSSWTQEQYSPWPPDEAVEFGYDATSNKPEPRAARS